MSSPYERCIITKSGYSFVARVTVDIRRRNSLIAIGDLPRILARKFVKRGAETCIITFGAISIVPIRRNTDHSVYSVSLMRVEVGQSREHS